ncbi:MAG: hypothetical protein IID36_05060 [Planctomycetes bacterium]|nr:hypothetical protein [Planctomycetota bacterium]
MNTRVTTTINLNTDSVLSVASLQADSPVAITLKTATDRLEASGSLLLGNKITITAPAGGTVRVGGDFLYTHENAADLSLGLAQLECVGDWQWLEVGGTDFNLACDSIPDDNFGYLQLIIGQAGHASVVQLVDLHDNHQPGVADALYLFNFEDDDCKGGIEGLRMLGGSTLVIGDLNVYAMLDIDENGKTDDVIELTRLHDLFEPGETSYRFNHTAPDGFINDGWIIRPEMFPPIGAIDARQPSNPDGSNPAGWTTIDLVFLGDPPPLPGKNEFEVEVTGGGTPPEIVGVTVGSYKVTVELDGPIPHGDGVHGVQTKITHVPSGSKTCVGYLPADVNNDRLSNANDILALINHLNDAPGPSLADYQTDIDRSGLTNASDILRVIDLLNGAGVYDPWNGATLPECP